MTDRANRTGVYEMPQNPDLADLFRVAMRGMQLQLRAHTSATVTAVSANGRKVSVAVNILQVIKDHTKTPTVADPNPTTTQPPVVLKDIPLAVQETLLGKFTLPVSVGDTGELHVQDRSLAQWLDLGVAVDPVSAFAHSLQDSVFHPTIHSDVSGRDPIDQTATVVDGAALVKIGAAASDFVALSTLVLAELAKVQTWANSHTHVTATSAGPTTSSPGLPTMAAPGSVAATKAQAE
jgi:hypothetical protein